jgi:hypothetical protein
MNRRKAFMPRENMIPAETDWKALDAQLLKHRKENFSVQVEPEKNGIEEGQIRISVTTNGTQWTSISLLKEEVAKVIEALIHSQKSTKTKSCKN